MLNIYEKPGGEEEPKKPVGIPIGGAFICSHCHLDSHEGIYLPAESKVIYICPDGHENVIDNFSLGL